jgi:putative spermidine/putrescine transport system substrate-binding protein
MSEIIRNLRTPNLTRRTILAGAGLVAVGAATRSLTPAFAADTVTVADPGGPYAVAFGEAFYKPFRADTGIDLVNVAREAEPTSQVKAMVEANSYLWDVVSVTLSSRKLLSDQGLLEPLDWENADMKALIEPAKKPDWMGTNVFGSILAYRADTMKNKPESWADFYDVRRFPGRRALPKSPIHTLEGALLADGVAADKIYPLDADRAFNKLDQIKPHIDVWWASFGQSTQLLQSGEVDFLATSNARAQAAIDSGSDVKLIWNQALFGLEGWAIPKGNPRAALAKKFIQYCASGPRQALYTKVLSYGPTNISAFDTIPAARAAQLPTVPDNFKKMVQINDDWWGANKDKMFDRFNAWLLR